MSKTFSFHGGIHPPENKKQSTRAPIKTAPIAKQLIIPIQQHIGAPAKPCVNVGDSVLKGQVIAKAQGKISVSVHAPTSGVISAISLQSVPHPSGLQAPCITLDSDGLDTWKTHQGLSDYKALKKGQLIDYIRDHGIAGMGGAGFPTDVKLHLGDDHIVNTLIINAAECEPYITADDMLIRERADQIVGGIAIINHLLQPSHILIGIEDNKPNAIRSLETALKDSTLNIDIVVVPTKYPSGGEKQLIKLLTGVEVPSGRIPADVGIVCQNVGTVAAVYQAVQHGRPLLSRIVTVTGDAVAHPQNLEALIGTPFNTLLEVAGIKRDRLFRLVMGGPMMGFTIEDEQIPVIKTSNCIIAASQEEMPPAPPAQACIRCGMCEQVCPAELLPQQLHWFAKSREFDKAKHHNLFDCIECGACSYVCPSNIPLVQYYRFAKTGIREEEAELRKAAQARQRFEARQARLEQEKIDKEIRRKERAEQAAKAQADKKAMAEKTVSPEDSIKQLKTAAAVTRTKLKKAQAELDKAQTDGNGDIAQLSLHLQQAKSAATNAQIALEKAEAGEQTANTLPDLKQLKTQAAVARTKLKKAQQALKTAEEKGQEGVETLRETLKDLEQKAQLAQAAYEAAEKGDSPTAQRATDTSLKDEVDKAYQTWQKSVAALETATANQSPAVAKMQAGVEKLKARYDEVLAALNAATSSTNQPSESQTNAEVDIKALKQQVSIMRTKLKKAEKQLETAESEDEIDALNSEMSRLTHLHAEAKAELDKAEAILLEKAAAQGIDLKQLKIDAALARAAVTKAERAIKKAQDENDASLEQLQRELPALQDKADQLSLTLSQFE